jgi:hypothetical protein
MIQKYIELFNLEIPFIINKILSNPMEEFFEEYPELKINKETIESYRKFKQWFRDNYSEKRFPIFSEFKQYISSFNETT